MASSARASDASAAAAAAASRRGVEQELLRVSPPLLQRRWERSFSRQGVERSSARRRSCSPSLPRHQQQQQTEPEPEQHEQWVPAEAREHQQQVLLGEPRGRASAPVADVERGGDGSPASSSSSSAASAGLPGLREHFRPEGSAQVPYPSLLKQQARATELERLTGGAR